MHKNAAKIFLKIISGLSGALRNTRIQLRLFLGFLLLSLIPVIITGIASYNSSSNAIKSKIENYSHELMRQLSQNIQTELGKINAVSYEILISKEVQDAMLNYSNVDTAGQSGMINDVYTALLDRFLSKKDITSAGITLASGKNILYYESIVNTYNSKLLNDIETKADEANSAPVWGHVDFGNGTKGLLTARCYKSITFQKNLGTIFVALEDSFLSNIYKDINIGDGADILILDSQGYIISSKISMYTGNIYKDLSLVKAINANKHRSDWVIPLSINSKDNLVAASKLGGLDWYVIGLIPFDYLNKEPKSVGMKTLVMLMLITIFAIAFSYIISMSISEPLKNLIKSMNAAKNGNLSVEITDNSLDEIGEVSNNFNNMLSNIKSLILQVYNQKLLMQKAELKQLQSQINPHFLYNSFYILQRMITIEDNANAIIFSKHLANYFRFIARNAADEVPLKKEVEHASVYADIQGMRFKKRLSIEFEELPEILKNIIVPRLILQPVIENAFEHGLKTKEKDGLLRVSYVYSEDLLQIIVEDNGDSVNDEVIHEIANSITSEDDPGKEVTAIVNIHRRIRLKFGETSGLSVMRSDIGGLKTVIEIRNQ